MPDYSKYNIPSPDWYHSPIAECNACTVVFLSEEEFTVKELLEAIEKHEGECVPKNWIHHRGYNINGHESWYDEGPVSDAEMVRLIEEHKMKTVGCLIKFTPRTY